MSNIRELQSVTQERTNIYQLLTPRRSLLTGKIKVGTPLL